jgi:hypothetical protein
MRNVNYDDLLATAKKHATARKFDIPESSIPILLIIQNLHMTGSPTYPESSKSTWTILKKAIMMFWLEIPLFNYAYVFKTRLDSRENSILEPFPGSLPGLFFNYGTSWFW